jgi:hypothetical protein
LHIPHFLVIFAILLPYIGVFRISNIMAIITDSKYELKNTVFRGQSVSIRQLMIIGWTTADVDAINALAEYGLATGDMCILLSVYRMRKMSVKSDASPLPLDINKDIQQGEKRFKYIHPMVEDERAWQIHFEVKRLVINYSIQDICSYLAKRDFVDHEILLPTDPQPAYNELVRMGMPADEKGFSPVTFRKHHRKIQK